MNIIHYGLKVLKLGITYTFEKGFAKDIISESTSMGIDNFEKFIESYAAQIHHLLALEEDEMKRQNIPQEKRTIIKTNIKEFIHTVDLDEAAQACLYNEEKLGDALSQMYKNLYQQETEEDFKYYQRMLRSLSNYALETIKNSKAFQLERILDCYNLLIALQQQQFEDTSWKKSISSQLHTLTKQFTASPKTTPRIFTVLAPRPPKSEYLISRELIKESIMKHIADKNHLILVNGMGGIGKSTVCKDLFHEFYTQSNMPLAWIDYTGSSLEDDFITQFFYPENELERKHKIKYFLHTEIDPNAIIFIDNLNASRLEDPFIEVLTNARCTIVCTSRNDSYDHFVPIKIDSLSINDCIYLYEKYAHIDYDKSDLPKETYRKTIETIITKVGRHTLTIEILGKIAYCEELTPDEILRQLEAKGIDMEGFAEMNLDENTLVGHLSKIFSVDKLDAQKKYILGHLAHCPNEQIPKEIKKWISASTNYDIKYLIKHGWFLEHEHTYYMHPIIKETVKKTCILHYQDYIPLLNSLSKLSMYDRNAGIKKALPYLSYMQCIIKQVENEINPDIAWIYFNLGWMYRLLGEHFTAIECFKKAIAQWTAPQMLDAKNLFDRSSPSDIEELEKEVSKLPLNAQVYQKHSMYIHTRMVNIFVQIGSTYQQLGDTFSARSWYDKMKQFQGLYFDPELDAQIYNNYALTYQIDYKNRKEQHGDSKDLDHIKQKAIDCFEQTILEFRKLKKQDEFMALAIRNAGAFYLECGEIQTAIAYLQDALKIRNPILSPDSPDRERNYYDLGTAYFLFGKQQTDIKMQLENYQTAYKYYMLCHKICKENAKDKINKISLSILERDIEECLFELNKTQK